MPAKKTRGKVHPPTPAKKPPRTEPPPRRTPRTRQDLTLRERILLWEAEQPPE